MTKKIQAFGRACEWCKDDLSRFYTQADKAPNKIFCSPKCANSYVAFENQFVEKKPVGSITVNVPDEETEELIDSLYV